ncbi:MAG: RES family NAD+ phosphorylase [Hyphomicrobiales bacterium]
MLKSAFFNLISKKNKLLDQPVLCSACFTDVGLRLEAEKIGVADGKKCKACGKTDGAKIRPSQLESFFVEFFGNGSFSRTEFGGANRLASNTMRHGKREVCLPPWLEADAHLLEDHLQLGLFRYGPALWRIGEIDQLIDLRNPRKRESAVASLVDQFPAHTLEEGFEFFKIRKDIKLGQEHNNNQFDSAPLKRSQYGRLDSKSLQVLYGSENLEICAHECRITIPDECFVASLSLLRPMHILDLASPSNDEADTEFSSLDLATQFLFSASITSYPITRSIAAYAKKEGYDGIRYPSYFSLIKPETVPNIALFDTPIASNWVEVRCINRVFLRSAQYDLRLGPLFQ